MRPILRLVAGGSDARPIPWSPGPCRATGETDPRAASRESRHGPRDVPAPEPPGPAGRCRGCRGRHRRLGPRPSGSRSAADGQTVLVGGEYTANSVTKFDAREPRREGSVGSERHGIGVPAPARRTRASRRQRLRRRRPRPQFNGFASRRSGGRPSFGASTGNSTGVQGHRGASTVGARRPAKTGVFGYAIQDADRPGRPRRVDVGSGVRGVSDSGAAVWAESRSGLGVRAAAPPVQASGAAAGWSHPLNLRRGPWLCQRCRQSRGIGVQGWSPSGRVSSAFRATTAASPATAAPPPDTRGARRRRGLRRAYQDADSRGVRGQTNAGPGRPWRVDHRDGGLWHDHHRGRGWQQRLRQRRRGRSGSGIALQGDSAPVSASTGQTRPPTRPPSWAVQRQQHGCPGP